MASLKSAESKYEQIAQKCKENPADKDAMADKAKAFAEVRHLQREQARAGDENTPSKKSLQHAYINRFPDDVRDKVRKRVNS